MCFKVQPFGVLQLLTDHPGEIVTREQLKEKLWPAVNFVGLNHSLNTAIQKSVASGIRQTTRASLKPCTV